MKLRSIKSEAEYRRAKAAALAEYKRVQTPAWGDPPMSDPTREALTTFGPDYFTKMRHDTVRVLAEDFARVVAAYGVKVSVRCYTPYGPDDDQPDPIVDVWREPEGAPHE